MVGGLFDIAKQGAQLEAEGAAMFGDEAIDAQIRLTASRDRVANEYCRDVLQHRIDLLRMLRDRNQRLLEGISQAQFALDLQNAHIEATLGRIATRDLSDEAMQVIEYLRTVSAMLYQRFYEEAEKIEALAGPLPPLPDYDPVNDTSIDTRMRRRLIAQRRRIYAQIAKLRRQQEKEAIRRAKEQERLRKQGALDFLDEIEGTFK